MGTTIASLADGRIMAEVTEVLIGWTNEKFVRETVSSRSDLAPQCVD